MKRALTAVALSVGLFVGLAGVASADDKNKDKGDDNNAIRSNFALFDGANPANLDLSGRTGVLCGVANNNNTALAPGKSFTYHVAVTNDGSGGLECKVIYTDLDFIRVKIPLGTSFSFSQAAGTNAFDAAVRLDCDKNVSGSMSAQGPKTLFCVSCDANDITCDKIINTP